MLFEKRLRWFVRFVVAILMVSCSHSGVTAQTQKMILVVGAPGAQEYGEQFDQWAQKWRSTIKAEDDASSQIPLVAIGSGSDSEQSDFQKLEAAIKSTDEAYDELWIVLMGHGTDDRKTSKFNLRSRCFGQ